MQSFQSFSKEYYKYLESVGETGFVESVTPPIAYVSGLPGAHQGEVVYFETGEMGIVFSLSQDHAEILVFSRKSVVSGTQVSRTNEILKLPVGEEYLGLSINPLGKSIHDSILTPKTQEKRFLEQIPPGIEYREKITEPLETGVTVVDMMVPLGKGQRQLVLGDRKTGKTEFLMQVMLMQARKGVVCIYVCIGKKKTDIKRVEEYITKTNIKENVIVIATNTTDPLGLIYISPYYGMSLAEYLRDKGREVLIIFDDLSTHAKFYREISLVARRFPGRSSYPGDIFYSHSRLLERGGNFNINNSVVPITCLPVVETIEGDISGYIQTNLMSITDGHVYFDKDLFEQGRRPAVNFFLSVTRVGRQTQSKLRWGMNRELNSFLTLLDKTQSFIHFGAEINEGIRSTLAMGSRITNFLDQPMGHVISINVQMILYCLIWVGAISETDKTNVTNIVKKAQQLYESNKEYKNMIEEIVNNTDDFNSLLGKVSSQTKIFLDYINK